MSPELTLKIQEWRAKEAAGTLTIDEMREIITVLRAGRATAVQPTAGSKVSRAKPKTAKPDTASLFDELDKL